MSINGLPLAGWDETSTWGVDGDTYYAQLTPNGVSDVDGPRVLIAPPRDLVREVSALAGAIAAVTNAPVEEVLAAMRRGVGPEDRPALGLLAPSVPVSTQPTWSEPFRSS